MNILPGFPPFLLALTVSTSLSLGLSGCLFKSSSGSSRSSTTTEVSTAANEPTPSTPTPSVTTPTVPTTSVTEPSAPVTEESSTPITTSPSQASGFLHPGLLHTEADFERMRSKIQAGEEPWASAWQGLITDGSSSLGAKPAPLSVIIRGGDGQNFGRVISQLRFAYGLALRWKISGDEAYAKRAVEFLNAWSSTLTAITGNADRFLAAGLYGYQFANVGEIMRTYDGWAAEDRARFKSMLLDIFYPLSHDFLVNHNGACISNYWANWDLANIANVLAIGVYADREDLYQEALDYLYYGKGNGALDNLVYYLHAGNLGQFQESGRDQGHTTLGVALFGAIARMAWSQNEDLFAYDNYRLLAASEYIARYNLMEEVPFVPYGPNCRSAGLQTVISDAARGHRRPAWELIYNQYQNRIGIAAPWSEKMAQATRPEIYGNGDQVGWGTLTESRDPLPSGGAPRGLTSELHAGSVILSWWGATGAESYYLKRATSASGPFTRIAIRTASQDQTFTDTAVVPGRDYYYQVTAISSQGESTPSNTAKAEIGPRLKVHLTFDEASNDTLRNAVDGSQIGQLHNGAQLGIGLLGQALQLDGTDDYASLSTGIAANLADYTVAAWVNLDEARTWARLFDFGDSDQRYMALAPSRAQYAITRISGYADQTITSSGIATGRWVHLAVTQEGNVGTLYVDGAKVGSGDFTLAPFRLGKTRQNWLGRSQYSADPFLKGRIDDVRLYSGPLSAEEIAELAKQ